MAAVGLRDPHVPGSWGYCPFLLVTGYYCPGCGGLRAVNDLVHLHPIQALGSNAMAVAVVVLGVVGGLAWLVSCLRGKPFQPERYATPARAYTFLAVLVVFSVLRNTPWGSWLAPQL